jgi:glycosyltransferase involved in cell wall biosynthesis
VLKRIVFLQYTNPAGYPPLEHSSQILAEAGWDVLFLGVESWGTAKLRFPDHPGIRVLELRRQTSGWLLKLHYLWFCCWCVGWIFRNRTSWVYASDLLSCPVVMIASILFRLSLVYHEHDSPSSRPPLGRFLRLCFWTRGICARRARITILPNGYRAKRFAEATRCVTPPLEIWNCPRRGEVSAPRSLQSGRIAFLYHGSIVPDRVPLTIIDALARLPHDVLFTVVGYETVGSAGYSKVLRDRALELGIPQRLHLPGPLNRRGVFEVSLQHEVGLALLPLQSADINFVAMTGASNKPFDYLACGLPLLVSILPEWEEMYVKPGYALSCDPTSVESIAHALGWFCDHPEQTRDMGERGRQKILSNWNYEAQFQPALKRLPA